LRYFLRLDTEQGTKQVLGTLRKSKFLSFLWERSDRLSRQSAALVTLARRQLLESNSFEQEMKVITELAANTLQVERVGVWLYDSQGLLVSNIDTYHRSAREHTQEKSIRSIDYPQYFRALESERAVVAEDARIDPRTSEYLDGYLLPKGIKSLLDAPIRAGGKVLGVICFEAVGRKRKWSIDDQNFASSVADIVAVSLETAERLKARKELRHRLEFEELLLTIANRFINVPVQDIPTVIDEALKTLGEFVGVDRCYVYHFNTDGLTMSNTNEWCNAGVDHKIHQRQSLPISSFPWGIAKIKNGEAVSFSEIDALPDTARTDQLSWKYFSVQSLVWVPLIENGKVFGFAGCTSTGRRIFWSDESIAVLKLIGETLANMYARERDLRERENAIEERRKLESRMQQTQKLESLGLLAGGIAHDFNNLLMGMLGNAGLLLLDLPKDSKAKERLEQIQKTAERAADLTSQLLAYSGKGKFVVESTDLGQLSHEMLDLLKPVISPRAKVVLDFAQELPSIEVDATQVRQVMMNLITNASDAIGDSEGEIRVRTGTSLLTQEKLKGVQLGEELTEGNYVFVEVSDDGCGMSAETAARIFDPFFTTKFTGRGLGLAAVHGIIRGHRGAISVDSAVGVGTTVRVFFPVARKTSVLTATRAEEPKTEILLGTVLVIDDEEPTRTVVKEMLERLGCRVFAEESGKDGLKNLEQSASEVSLVLLDLTMPVMDGEQTFREIRRRYPDLPVVIMSGYSETETLSRIKGERLADFIQKPFGPAALREQIERFIPSREEPRLRLVK